MQMDIIFLDIDGVLNPDKESYDNIFSPECVMQLKRILKHHPKAHVVFSSSWRTGFSAFTLGWLWRQHDLPLKRVIGSTPHIGIESRGMEIRQWLMDAARYRRMDKVRNYAVLDDEVESILEHIPKNTVFTCNPEHGLTEDIADRVIDHFSAPSVNLELKSAKRNRSATLEEE